jgi:hypothetical protein
MAGLREHRRGTAKAFLLQHPSASIRQAAQALPGISERTIAQARSELAAAGLLPAGRNRKPSILAGVGVPPIPPEPVPAPPSEGTGDRLLTDDQVIAMADPSTGLLDELDGLDDEETRKRLLREVKRLAFSPDTHPDTKLSATQVWLKLKDMAKAKDLGPGKPLTRAAALARLTDLHTAVDDVALVVEAACAAFGPGNVVKALYALMGISEPVNEGELPADDGQAQPGSAGATPASGSAPDLPAPDGPAGP